MASVHTPLNNGKQQVDAESPRRSGDVQFFDANYTGIDSKSKPYNPVVAIGWGEENPITYVYNPDPEHALRIPSDHSREFENTPHINDVSLAFNKGDYVSITSRNGVTLDTPGKLSFVVGNQFSGKVTGTSDLAIKDAIDAKLYIAALDKAAQRYAEIHAEQLDKDFTTPETGHGNYNHFKTDAAKCTGLAKLAAETALIERSIELNTLDPSLRNTEKHGYVRENAGDLMEALLHRYIGFIASAHCKKTPIKAAITRLPKDNINCPQFELKGFSDPSSSVTFTKTLHLKLESSKDSCKALGMEPGFSHPTHWVLEETIESPGNLYQSTPRKIAIGTLDEKGLSGLLELLAKQPVAYGTDRSLLDVPLKFDMASMPNGRLFADMVDHAFKASLQCEIDVPYEGAKLTQKRRDRVIIPALVRELGQQLESATPGSQEYKNLEHGISALTNNPSNYPETAANRGLPPLPDGVEMPKGTVPTITRRFTGYDLAR